MSNPPIVAVGIDGSEQALTAAKWALDVAGRRHIPLEVIHSWSIPLPPVGLGPAPVGLSDEHVREAAQSVLDDATTRLTSLAPEVAVTGTLYPGTPTSALLEAVRAVLACRRRKFGSRPRDRVHSRFCDAASCCSLHLPGGGRADEGVRQSWHRSGAGRRRH